MPRRRPVLANAGAVACAALLAGCSSGPVAVETPDLPAADAAACRQLVQALPERVSGLERRPVDPSDATAAAWGEPSVVLTSGVREPAAFDELSSCQITNGVAWFIPDEQITGTATDITMTTIGRAPGVRVTIPADYFPPAATMVDLADALRQHTDRIARCG